MTRSKQHAAGKDYTMTIISIRERPTDGAEPSRYPLSTLKLRHTYHREDDPQAEACLPEGPDPVTRGVKPLLTRWQWRIRAVALHSLIYHNALP